MSTTEPKPRRQRKPFSWTCFLGTVDSPLALSLTSLEPSPCTAPAFPAPVSRDTLCKHRAVWSCVAAAAMQSGCVWHHLVQPSGCDQVQAGLCTCQWQATTFNVRTVSQMHSITPQLDLHGKAKSLVLFAADVGRAPSQGGSATKGFVSGAKWPESCQLHSST